MMKFGVIGAGGRRLCKKACSSASSLPWPAGGVGLCSGTAPDPAPENFLRRNSSINAVSVYAMYLNPDYSTAYYRLVQVAGAHGDFPRALRVAEEAVRRFPENAHSYGCRGYALGNLRRHAEAVEDLSTAIVARFLPRLAAIRWYCA